MSLAVGLVAVIVAAAICGSVFGHTVCARLDMRERRHGDR